MFVPDDGETPPEFLGDPYPLRVPATYNPDTGEIRLHSSGIDPGGDLVVQWIPDNPPGPAKPAKAAGRGTGTTTGLGERRGDSGPTGDNAGENAGDNAGEAAGENEGENEGDQPLRPSRVATARVANARVANASLATPSRGDWRGASTGAPGLMSGQPTWPGYGSGARNMNAVPTNVTSAAGERNPEAGVAKGSAVATSWEAASAAGLASPPAPPLVSGAPREPGAVTVRPPNQQMPLSGDTNAITAAAGGPEV